MEGKTELELTKRHDEAIELITSDLERLREYLQIYQLQGIYLMDPAYGNSPSGNRDGMSGTGSGVSHDAKMINRIIKNDKIVEFIEEYTSFINMLPPLNRKIIVQWVCYPNEKNRWEKFFWGGYRLNKNQYYNALKTSINLLAIYCPKTDYDAIDYIDYKGKKKRINHNEGNSQPVVFQ